MNILWFRQDLRISDHPALHAALKKGPIIPIYIWAPEEEGEWPPGAASRWWLHRSLESLKKDLIDLGYPLIIRKGPSLKHLMEIAKQTRASAIFWQDSYEPTIIQRDAFIKEALNQKGIETYTSKGSLLFDPSTITTKSNSPFKVFTPFWNCCLKTLNIDPPLPKIPKNKFEVPKIESLSISDLDLLPKIPWDKGLQETWLPGEKNAHKALEKADLKIGEYSVARDRPDLEGVSKLSPYLHFGELSPRQVYHALKNCQSSEVFLRQIGWREFAYYLLYHFPHTPTEPLREDFNRFPWKSNKQALSAWQKGQTGYPFVDAGMRELWHTGWMHNRVRMIVASFLVKDLKIPWQEGTHWFWDTLVDADLANNTLGWQWTAGCGADAAPYFRIFNPTSQGEKFDVTRSYVKKWVPELSNLPDKWLYKPWLAPDLELHKAGILLGKDYPYPILDHSKARKEALEAYHKLQSKHYVL